MFLKDVDSSQECNDDEDEYEEQKHEERDDPKLPLDKMLAVTYLLSPWFLSCVLACQAGMSMLSDHTECQCGMRVCQDRHTHIEYCTTLCPTHLQAFCPLLCVCTLHWGYTKMVFLRK